MIMTLKKAPAVLSEYQNKRLIIERKADSTYIQIIAVDGGQVSALSSYLPNVPMWLRKQIPIGFSCIAVSEKPHMVDFNAQEEELLQELQELRYHNEQKAKDTKKQAIRPNHNNLALLSALSAMSMATHRTLSRIR